MERVRNVLARARQGSCVNGVNTPRQTRASVSRRPRPPRSLRQRASLLHAKRVVTMRSIPVFMRVLAQFSKFRTPSDLSDGLTTGAFDIPLPLAQGRSSIDTHSGATPFHWTAIRTINRTKLRRFPETQFKTFAMASELNPPCFGHMLDRAAARTTE